MASSASPSGSAATTGSEPDAASSSPATLPTPADLTVEELNSQIRDIEKSVGEKETRLTSRALRRFFTTTRKCVTPISLASVVSSHVPEAAPHDETRRVLLGYISKLPTPMEAEPQAPVVAPTVTSLATLLPEVEIYLRLLVTVSLLDNKIVDEATASSAAMISRLQSENRRTLNPLAAKAFFYYSRSFELADRLAEIRPVLLAAHRTSSLHHDDETHATILNLLLRNYLHYNLYDQADKLQSKSSLKEDATSSNQLARFRYYQGRIKGIQLDYTGAYTDLQEAIRKAPQHSVRGFRQTVHKFACIVQLLMGEIPERSIFRQKGLRLALKPYLQLTQAVRVGDLASFHDVLRQFGDVFKADKTYTLIQRLRRNVIKTGLRKINVSYSRISLTDICQKLHLDSVEDAEFIVAKAIRDGVIDATVDHKAGSLRSKVSQHASSTSLQFVFQENIDVYSTQEPLEAFNMRTNFCLKMHNEAVKGMRYPPDMPKPSVFLESEEQKEKAKQEKEFLEKSAHEDDEDEI